MGLSSRMSGIGDALDAKRGSLQISHMPTILILTELFILVMCSLYMMRLAGGFADIYVAGKFNLMDLIFVGMNMFSFFTAIDAVFSITSRRARAWRSVIISCILFALTTWFSEIMAIGMYAGYFIPAPIPTTILSAAIILIMILSNKIRKFYTPPTVTGLTTADWVKYLCFIDVFGKERRCRSNSANLDKVH